ncbi:MAG TPA: type VI secretion system-associated protein TagF [Plasticicumulans sp.]|nr:type VI secretion system-associated protein TagF [Plasticicumulans sp.]
MAACGFYGKLASRGDFVSRRLPREFVEPWDGWLQAGLSASREQLGDGWLDCYLTSPLWRFVLAPGCCGPQATVAGVLMPSVDRVGRYFPLTLACSLDGELTPDALARDAGDWYAQAEALALATLEETLDLDGWDAAVAALGARAAAVGLALPGTPMLGHFEDLADAGSMAGRLAQQRLRPDWRGSSLWWTLGSERIEPCVILAEGLPPAGTLGSFFDGDFARAGYAAGDTAGSTHDQ